MEKMVKIRKISNYLKLAGFYGMRPDEMQPRTIRKLTDIVAKMLSSYLKSHGSQVISPVTREKETSHSFLKMGALVTTYNLALRFTSVPDKIFQEFMLKDVEDREVIREIT